MRVKADTGGDLSKKLWTSIELTEFMFAGQTNILQERWLGEFAPLCRSKDLGAKRRGFILLGPGFFPKLWFLFWISGFGGGG